MTTQKKPGITRWTANRIKLWIAKVDSLSVPSPEVESILSQPDDLGLSLAQSITLETLRSTQDIQMKISELLAPRSGELSDLEKLVSLNEGILHMLTVLAKRQAEAIKKIDQLESLMGG